MVLDPRFFQQYTTPVSPAPSVQRYSGIAGRAMRERQQMAEQARSNREQEQLQRESQEAGLKRTKMATTDLEQMRQDFAHQKIEEERFVNRRKKRVAYANAYNAALANNDESTAQAVADSAMAEGISITRTPEAPPEPPPELAPERGYVGPSSLVDPRIAPPLPQKEPGPEPGSLVIEDQDGVVVIPHGDYAVARERRRQRIRQIAIDHGLDENAAEAAIEFAESLPGKPEDIFPKFLQSTKVLGSLKRRGQGGGKGGLGRKAQSDNERRWDRGASRATSLYNSADMKELKRHKTRVSEASSNAKRLIEAFERGDTKTVSALADILQKQLAALLEPGKLSDKDVEYAASVKSWATQMRDFVRRASVGSVSEDVVQAQSIAISAMATEAERHWQERVKSVGKAVDSMPEGPMRQGGRAAFSGLVGEDGGGKAEVDPLVKKAGY